MTDDYTASNQGERNQSVKPSYLEAAFDVVLEEPSTWFDFKGKPIKVDGTSFDTVVSSFIADNPCCDEPVKPSYSGFNMFSLLEEITDEYAHNIHDVPEGERQNTVIFDGLTIKVSTKATKRRNRRSKKYVAKVVRRITTNPKVIVLTKEQRIELVIKYYNVINTKIICRYGKRFMAKIISMVMHKETKTITRDGCLGFVKHTSLFKWLYHEKICKLKENYSIQTDKSSDVDRISETSERPTLVTNMFSTISKTVESINNISTKGIDVNISGVEKAVEDIKVVGDTLGQTLREEINQLRAEISQIKTVDVNVNHSFLSAVPTRLKDTTNVFFDFVSTNLPQDPRARTVALIILFNVIVYMVKDLWKTQHWNIGKIGFMALAYTFTEYYDDSILKAYVRGTLAIEAGSSLLSMVLAYFQEEEEEEETEEGEEVKLIPNSLEPGSDSWVRTIIQTISLALFGHDIYIGQDPKSVIKNYGNTCRSLTDLVNNIYNLFAEVVDFATSKTGIQILRTRMNLNPTLFEISKVFEDLKWKITHGSLKVRDYNNIFIPAVGKLNEMHRSLMHTQNTNAISFVSYLRQMEKYLDMTFRLEGLIKDRTRCRPYKITLASKPRRGKTLLSANAVDICARLFLDEEEYSMFTENRSSIVHSMKLSQEFQDGLTNNHKILVLDDFLQSWNESRDAMKCEAVKYTAIDNNEPCMANMAFNKGEVYIEPYAVIANTNLLNFDKFRHAMIDPKAFQFRVSENLYIPDIKEEYRKYLNPKDPDDYVFDEERFSELTTSPYVIKHYTYIPNGETNGTIPVCENVYDYEQWSRYIAVKALNWQIKEEASLKRLTSIRNDPKFFIFHGMSRDQAVMDLVMNPPKGPNDKIYLEIKDPETAMKKALEGRDPNKIMEPFMKYPTLMTLLNPLPKMMIERNITRLTCLDMQYLNDIVSSMSTVFVDQKPERIVELLSHLVTKLDKNGYFRKSYLESEEHFDIRRQRLLNNFLDRNESTLKEYIPSKKEETNYLSSIRDALMKYIPDEIDLFDKMVYADKEFVEYVEQNKGDLMNWYKNPGDSADYKKVAKQYLFDPTADIYILWRIMKTLFVTVCRIGREFGMMFYDIIQVLRKSTWSNVCCNAYSVVKEHLSNVRDDIYRYLETSFYGIFVGISGPILIGSTIGLALGLYINFIKDNSSLITNSMLAIKFRPGKKAKNGTVARKGVITRDGKESKEPVVKSSMGPNAYEPKKNHTEIINAVLPSNMYTLMRQEGDGWRIVQNLLFIKGRTAIFNGHAYNFLLKTYADKPDAKIRIIDFNDNRQDYYWKDCKFTIFEDIDACLITFPKQCMERPKIIKYFVKNDELPSSPTAHENLSFMLAYMTLEDGIRYLNKIPVRTICDTFHYSNRAGDFKHQMYGFLYSVEGHESACMSPLLMADHRLPDTYRICALHCSGNDKGGKSVGAGIPMTQEILEEMLEQSYENSTLQPRDPRMVTNSFPVEKYPCYGTSNDFYNNEYSSIRKGKFYGFMGDEIEPKEPTPLQPYSVETPDGTVIHDPIVNALKQYCQPMPAINQDLLELALAMFIKRWEDNSNKPCEMDIWDKTRIIEGDGIVGPDKRDTSPGPYFKSRKIKMTDLYGFEGARLKETMPPLFDELWDEFEEICTKLEQGIVPDFKYLGFLKSETVKKSKILEGKSRYISGPDKFSIWAKRKYFGSLVSSSIKNGFMNGFLTGLNPYSTDWDSLAKVFLNIYKCVYDGDFKNFDGHLAQFLFSIFSQFCRYVYSHQEEKYHLARDALIWDLANSVHYVPCSEDTEEDIEEGIKIAIIHFIIQFKGSLPSGDFLTQMFGTFSNHILIYYNRLMSWVREQGISVGEYSIAIHPKPRIDELSNDIFFVALSDDHLIGVRRLINGWNPRIIKENYAEIGCKYTAADKEAEVTEEWKSILDCMLLRRFFVWDEYGSRIIAPIDDASIFNSLYWTECKDKNLDLVLKTDFQELSLKPIERFNYVVNKLKKHAEAIRYKIPGDYMDYHSCRSRVLNSTYAPWGDLLITNCLENEKFSDSLTSRSDVILGNSARIDDEDKHFGCVLSGRFNDMKLSKILDETDELRTYRPTTDKCKCNLNNMKSPIINNNVNNKANYNLITNMDATVTVDKVENTAFIDTGSVITREMSVVPELKQVTEDSHLADFLKTPRYVGTYVYSNSSVPNATLFDYDPINFFLTTDVANKIKGRGLVRGTFCAKIVINANPFQAGRLYFRFLPLGIDMAVKMYASRTIGLMTKTQQPGTYVSLADTGAVLKMPYIAPTSFLDLNAMRYVFGLFSLDIVTPLRTGSTADYKDADVTLWVWLEDAEFAQPMVPNAVGTVSEKERKATSEKPLSSGLRTIATVAKGLSAIPPLAAYAQTTAWAADRLACVASSFGYSKPLLDSACTPANVSRYRYLGTSDGYDDSFVASLKQGNTLKIITDITPRPVDEMSWAFLRQQEFFFRSYTWTTTSPIGVLQEWNISPQIFYTSGSYSSAAKTAVYNETNPINLMTYFFTLWRGSFKIKLRLNKTQYHSGRLMVIWQPTNYTATAPSIANSTYCMREIIDLQTDSEAEFDLPWILPQNYISTGETSGHLSIVVLNQLRAPNSVADTVDIIMTVSGCDDLEFAAPIQQRNKTVMLKGNADETLSSSVLEPKGSVSIRPAEESIGEIFSSVKQLITRAQPMAWNSLPTASNTWKIDPWYHTGVTSVTGTTQYANVPGGDLTSIIGGMYLFYRGSMRITVTPDGSKNNTYATLITSDYYNPNYVNGVADYPTLQGVWGTPNGGYFTSPSTLPLETKDTGTISIMVPYYNDVRCSMVTYPLLNDVGSKDSSEPSVALLLENVDLRTVPIYRSVGDDFQYAYFIGCMPMFANFT